MMTSRSRPSRSSTRASWKRKERKPAKKFVATVSEARKREMDRKGPIEKYQSHDPRFNFTAGFHLIFRGAQILYRLPRKPNSRVIFIGSGMRPLFETIRGLNEIHKSFPRGDFRYLISTLPGGSSEGPNIQSLIQTIRERKIVSSGKITYYIIDYQVHGRTIGAVIKAIKAVNPNAEVETIPVSASSDEGQLDKINTAIIIAEQMPRPTHKTSEGKFLRDSEFEDMRWRRRRYLYFQHTLQEWLKTQK